jgi:hypothetical protein
MTTMKDWNGHPVAVRRSRGASQVPYLEDWRRNVVGLADSQTVPPWLRKQVRSYVAHRRWFSKDDADALAAQLGRISKFQSLRSEDAITWSWFGTLAQAQAQDRQAAVQWLYDELGLDLPASAAVAIRQWPRVLHPNASTKNGPEVDAVIDDPHGALIYVEAKWAAALGTGQGAGAGQADDQVVLRRDSLRKDPARAGDERPFVVLGVAPAAASLDAYAETDPALRPVSIRWLTWSALSGCAQHPLAAEFERYLQWKTAGGA